MHTHTLTLTHVRMHARTHLTRAWTHACMHAHTNLCFDCDGEGMVLYDVGISMTIETL